MILRDVDETFSEFTRERPGYRRALLLEVAQLVMDAEFRPSQHILNRFVNDTLGYPALARELEMPEAEVRGGLERMGPSTAGLLVPVLNVLKRHEGVRLVVQMAPVKAKAGLKRAA